MILMTFYFIIKLDARFKNKKVHGILKETLFS